MSSSVDEIFQISSDEETSTVVEDKRKRKKSTDFEIEESESRDQSNRNNPDYTEAIDELQEQIDARAIKFEREFEELKRRHAEQLSLLKHSNVTREQATANSYDIEYRNVVWSVTLRHLGKGVFAEDIGPLFEHNLSEQQFKLEKELLELQQTYDDELAQMRAQMAGKGRRRRRVRRIPGTEMQPQQLARMICDRLDELEPREVEDDSNDVILSQLIKMIKKENEEILDRREAFIKRQRPKIRERKMYHPPPEPPRARPKNPEPSFLASHKAASNKLVKSMAKADRFLKNLQKQEWFDDLFPHVE